MTLPTREQVQAEVDAAFSVEHPDAPKHLDPNNPAHAPFVAAWNQLFTLTVNFRADEVFTRFYPETPALDPHNPDHADLVRYWTDIRDAIHNGTPSQYDWDSEPATDTNQSHGNQHPTQAGAIPTFTYTLPGVPLAFGEVDTEVANVYLQFTLTGQVTITFPNGTVGVTTPVNEETWRSAAARSLRGIIDGAHVQDLGSRHARISTALTEFAHPDLHFTAPSTLICTGESHLEYDYPTHLGLAAVQGKVAYQLDATVDAHAGAPEPEIMVEGVEGWLAFWGLSIRSAGATPLQVLVYLAEHPERDGGHLEVNAH
jgi:hypothetical protein